MKLSSQVKAAFYNLLFSPLRSLLAMLGILVGTASVVALLSSGELATQRALEQFKMLGTELLAVSFSPPAQQGAVAQTVPISRSSLENMSMLIPDITTVSPYIAVGSKITFQGDSFDGNVIGATQSLKVSLKIQLKMGRFISDLDTNRFCVIGSGIYHRLKTINVLGQRIKLGDSIFTIIGIVDDWPESGFFNQNINDSAIVPIETVNVVAPNLVINNLVLQLKPNSNIDQVKAEITQYLNKLLPEYQVSFRSAKEIIKSMSEQKKIFTLLLGLIGSIALFVGGIGVMNIMLVSVTERRSEIGLRLALGAQPKDIQTMFLIEAIFLAVFGGGMGVVVGVASSYIIARASGWNFIFFLYPAIVGFVVSVLISVIFGFYPAYRASRLNPIEALRQ